MMMVDGKMTGTGQAATWLRGTSVREHAMSYHQSTTHPRTTSRTSSHHQLDLPAPPPWLQNTHSSQLRPAHYANPPGAQPAPYGDRMGLSPRVPTTFVRGIHVGPGSIHGQPISDPEPLPRGIFFMKMRRSNLQISVAFLQLSKARAQ